MSEKKITASNMKPIDVYKFYLGILIEPEVTDLPGASMAEKMQTLGFDNIQILAKKIHDDLKSYVRTGAHTKEDYKTTVRAMASDSKKTHAHVINKYILIADVYNRILVKALGLYKKHGAKNIDIAEVSPKESQDIVGGWVTDVRDKDLPDHEKFIHFTTWITQLLQKPQDVTQLKEHDKLDNQSVNLYKVITKSDAIDIDFSDPIFSASGAQTTSSKGEPVTEKAISKTEDERLLKALDDKLAADDDEDHTRTEAHGETRDKERAAAAAAAAKKRKEEEEDALLVKKLDDKLAADDDDAKTPTEAEKKEKAERRAQIMREIKEEDEAAEAAARGVTSLEDSNTMKDPIKPVTSLKLKDVHIKRLPTSLKLGDRSLHPTKNFSIKHDLSKYNFSTYYIHNGH